MYRSAIEDELKLWALSLSGWVRDRDRGVLLGLLFCAVPIPPITLVGIAIGLWNLRLIARGRLAVRERRLVWTALTIGLLCLILGMTVFVFLATLAWRMRHDGAEAVWAIGTVLRWLLERVLGSFVQFHVTGPGLRSI